jgi:AraC-like DNA-binding protein
VLNGDACVFEGMFDFSVEVVAHAAIARVQAIASERSTSRVANDIHRSCVNDRYRVEVSRRALERLAVSCQAMSRKGHMCPAPERPVTVMAFDIAQGTSTGRHAHPFGQLVHAAEGVMRVHTDRGTWIVPPERAVWVPPELEHDVEMVTSVAMRTVYTDRGVMPHAPSKSCVVPVSSLLRELILEALRLPRTKSVGDEEERLLRVLLDQISFSDVVPLHLPMPKSARLQDIARALQRDPSDKRTLAAWAKLKSGSARTLAREFRRETGLSFGAWRAQLRLMRALEMLALKHSVTDVALSLGYESTSAFITRFRRHLGTTPARFFHEREPSSASRSIRAK